MMWGDVVTTMEQPSKLRNSLFGNKITFIISKCFHNENPCLKSYIESLILGAGFRQRSLKWKRR